MDDTQKIIELMLRHNHFLVTTHIRPDGDAFGSVSGLARALLHLGKTVQVALVEAADSPYSFVLEGLPQVSPETLSEHGFEVVMVVDSGDFPRTGMESEIRGLGIPVINIDHHGTNPRFGTWNVVNAQASSTAEMLVELLQAANIPLLPVITAGLYMGIFTDTRYFQNDSVSVETFRRLVSILEGGLDPRPLMAAISANKSLTDLRILGLALGRAEPLADGRITHTTITADDIVKHGATARHCWSAGVFSHLNQVSNALVAVTFIEDPGGLVFCEFRAKYGFDVRPVAVSFGGGGHRSASGCSQQRPLAPVREEILSTLVEMVKKHQDSTI